MIAYAACFLWGFVILFSWMGWGTAVNRVLAGNRRWDMPQRAALGIAVSVAAGGILNLCGVISNAVVLIFMGLGLATFVWTWLREAGAPQSDRPRAAALAGWMKPALLVAIGLAGLQYATSVSLIANQAQIEYITDDYQAYLGFPARMLSMGSLGYDPFSTRRIEGGLAGQSFLHTFVLAVFDFHNLRLLDAGVGLLLLMWFLWAMARERRLPRWTAPVLALLVLLPIAPNLNISSYYTGCVMFLALWRTLTADPESLGSYWPRALLAGLELSAIVALKTTFIPTAGAWMACCAVLWIMERPRRAWGEVALMAATSLALILPWMIALHQSSGTYLYPLLGRGYHHVYRLASSSEAASRLWFNKRDAMFQVAILLGAVFVAMRRMAALKQPAFWLLAGALGGWAFACATTSSPRYAYPFMLAALLAVAVEILSGSGTQTWRCVATAALLLSLGRLTMSTSRFFLGYYHESVLAVVTALRHDSFSYVNPDQAAYRALQASTPPGALLLARLDYPYLLDFRRNPVYMLDYAAVSPPPGMPMGRDPEALADYLRGQSIRYVAHSYATESSRRYTEYIYPMFRFHSESTYIFEDNVDALAKTRKHVFDDGHNLVLDLGSAGGNRLADRY